MLLPRFEFHEPHTLEDACRLMGELGEKARPLAGGTDLLVNMKKKILAPEHLVSLGRIEPIGELSSDNDGLRLGVDRRRVVLGRHLVEPRNRRNADQVGPGGGGGLLEALRELGVGHGGSFGLGVRDLGLESKGSHSRRGPCS